MKDAILKEITHRSLTYHKQLLRHRLGEIKGNPVEPGLFAFIKNRLIPNIRFAFRIAARLIFARPIIFSFLFIIIFYSVSDAIAVPICCDSQAYPLHIIDSPIAIGSVNMYSPVTYHNQGTYEYLTKAENIELLYNALESQYAFLDNNLYRLPGDNYLLGAVNFPYWHGFYDVYYLSGMTGHLSNYVQMSLISKNTLVDGPFDGALWLGETIFRQNPQGLNFYFPLVNHYSPDLIHNMNPTSANVAVVPEPSSILLFCLAGVITLRMRKSGR